MSAAADPTIWIGDIDSLDYEDADGLTQAPVDFNGARVRVIRYEAGTTVPLHKHTKKTLKVILRGKMAFEGLDGPLGEVSGGGIYLCGMGDLPRRCPRGHGDAPHRGTGLGARFVRGLGPSAR
jgi:hypothetical protein